MQFQNLIKLVNIIFVDLIFAGDNAIVIGMVAASFSPDYRKKVIFYGVAVAVILRILFAIITVQLLALKGLLLIGGLLLLWICWRLWRDLQAPQNLPVSNQTDKSSVKNDPPLTRAIIQIVIADLSMSLDNVLAVAGIAEGHITILVIGLVLSVAFMIFSASLIANTLQKYRWIGYIGLVIILYVAGKMIIQGALQLTT